MKKVVLIVLLTLLAACAGQDAEVSIESPFIGGSQGVLASFQDFRGEVFDGGTDPFDVIIRLENKGEAKVPGNNVRVMITGVNPVEFSKSQDQLIAISPDDILANRKVEGEILPSPPSFVEFAGLNHAGSIAGASVQLPLRANICYLYRTKAISELCVRSNVLTPRAGGICEINEQKEVFNSGAPVHIQDFKESARSQNKVGFSFTVANVGGGNLYERNSVCGKRERKNQNRVFVIVKTGIQGLKCTGLEDTASGAEGFITLYGGNKIVSCTQDVSSGGDYKQIVNIEAIYDYEQSIQETLTVKTAGEI